jgi:hypothetical protein
MRQSLVECGDLGLEGALAEELEHLLRHVNSESWIVSSALWSANSISRSNGRGKAFT